MDGAEEDDGHEDCAEGPVPRMHAPADSTGELVRLNHRTKNSSLD